MLARESMVAWDPLITRAAPSSLNPEVVTGPEKTLGFQSVVHWAAESLGHHHCISSLTTCRVERATQLAFNLIPLSRRKTRSKLLCFFTLRGLRWTLLGRRDVAACTHVIHKAQNNQVWCALNQPVHPQPDLRG